jgi:hypothetical protein
MSRANLLIITVLVLALAGMFFWTLNLEQRIAADNGDSLAPTGDGGLGDRFLVLEQKVEVLEELGRANKIGLNEMQGDIVKLEGLSGDLNRRLASLAGTGGGDGAAAVNVPADLKEAVAAVLNERAEEERKQRNERWAQGMARYFLADIEATDEQKKQFVKVVSSYMDERRTISEKYREQGDSGNEARDADLKKLEEDRNTELLTIFGANDYAKIEERFNRTRNRMGGGRFGGNRGGGRTPR